MKELTQSFAIENASNSLAAHHAEIVSLLIPGDGAITLRALVVSDG